MTALVPTPGLAPLTRFEPAVELTATEPAERRGLRRDGVRLLVAQNLGVGSSGDSDGDRWHGGNSHDDGNRLRVSHSRFDALGRYLDPGDLIVVNTSATLAGEIDAKRRRGTDGGHVVLHVATKLDDQSWVVELRSAPKGERPVLDAVPGEVISLRRGARVRLIEPYPSVGASPTGQGTRLWRAWVGASVPFTEYLQRHGRPISYGYLKRQ